MVVDGVGAMAGATAGEMAAGGMVAGAMVAGAMAGSAGATVVVA